MGFLRQLIDPNTAPLRSLSREVRELFISANNGWIMAFDNLSFLPNWMSDALCRLATGGGFTVRQLHTDGEEAIFNAVRPIMLNGIENVGARGDLVDRAVILILEPITEENRKTIETLEAEFNTARPIILGALLDMMVHGLKNLPNVHLTYSPRMADFARWAAACETANWPPGTFKKAYYRHLFSHKITGPLARHRD
jgi:hypothetical protein